MSQSVLRAAAAVGLAFFLVGSTACLAEPSGGRSAGAGEDRPPLPTDPRLWHNSPPLTIESLKGKGVVFYFFDEECPNCAAGWPDVQKTARAYEGKPVLFLAVNSGTDPRLLKRYLGKYRVKWPVISDPTREFESAMGVPRLRAQTDTYALKYVSGDGKAGEIQEADLAAAAEAALKGAEWRVDPKGLPAPLLSAWKAIELGDFAAAARTVNRALESKAPDVRVGGQKLHDAVTDEIKSIGREAATALRDDDTWTAYKLLRSIEDRFGAYDIDLVEDAAKKAEEFSKIDAVSNEITASRKLDKALARRSGRDLKRVATKYPSTEAGAKASKLLAKLGQ